MTDTTTGVSSAQAGTAYSGPVGYLQMQFISPTQDSVNITSEVPNAYIVTGAGNDAIDVSHANGQNVISAGAGNNFLTGGSGNDTFFVDDRTAGQAIWDTINGFHAGDAATVWGMTPQALTWQNNMGAAGYTGLTLLAPQPGGANFDALTLSGFSTADLASGKITTAFGTDASGDPYLIIQGH
jgi:serralysin